MQVSAILHPWRLATLALSAAGAGLFWLIGMPLPILLGPMFACLIAALAGMPLKGVEPLGEMALSVALIPPFILVIALAGYPYFRRLWGYDHPTSYYAAMPGGLQDMVLFGIEAGADPRALSLIHTTRVLVIVSIMPFLIQGIWGLSLDGALGEPAASVPLPEYAIMLVTGALGWWAAAKIGLFGAPILGPMIVAGAASLGDLLHHRPPAEAMQIAQFFLGLGIGVKYAGITVTEIRRILTASVGYCVVLAVLAVIFAEIVIQTGLAPPLDAILAFAPGGQAEMVLLAIVAGTDIAYVVTHHLVRVVVVILGAPVAARLVAR